MRLEDGFPTLVSFSLDAGIFERDLWIKRITPPGVDGGGPIEDTSMHNLAWRTKYPKSLKTMSDATLIVSFDPDAYDTVTAMVNRIQNVTYLFPSVAEDELSVSSWINTFMPNEFSEGNQPEATMQIIAANQYRPSTYSELTEAPPSYSSIH